MKKTISLVLAVLMVLLTMVMPVGAVQIGRTGSDIPVVAIFGDGEPIYDTDGNMIFKFSEILSILGDTEDGAASEAVMNVLEPFLLEGIIHDEWDNYYAALEKEIGEIFAEVRYDKNGENPNGTDISKSVRQAMADNLKRDTKQTRGSYYVYDYQFWYDWRQDPLKTADEFNAYIQGIKKITGAPKVSVLARCLGTSVVMAYIAKYGTDDLHGVAFNGGIAMGAEIISETISGKFTVDVAALNRMLKDFESLDALALDDFINSSLDLVAKTGKAGDIDLRRMELYGKLAQGVTSALSLGTFFTWPGYWACVAKSDFENAKNYVFGKEGSEKRTEYAELIKKIDNYYSLVTDKMDTLLDELENNKVLVGVIAKYGYQIAPICESCDVVADQYVSVNKASFGATTSMVYNTLTEDYIAERTAEGKDKYISPDKQIDASTCRFPDSTWFTKGISHSFWSDFETDLLYTVITADKQLYIDDFDFTQYIVYDRKTNTVEPMTEENCRTEAWQTSETQDNPQNPFEKIISWLTSLFVWIKNLIVFVSARAQ